MKRALRPAVLIALVSCSPATPKPEAPSVPAASAGVKALPFAFSDPVGSGTAITPEEKEHLRSVLVQKLGDAGLHPSETPVNAGSEMLHGTAGGIVVRLMLSGASQPYELRLTISDGGNTLEHEFHTSFECTNVEPAPKDRDACLDHWSESVVSDLVKKAVLWADENETELTKRVKQ